MEQKTFEAFELFVEKTEKLKSFDFVKFPKRGEFNWSLNQGNEKVEISKPSDQIIDGFLLTYRFFINQNEHCSFCWLANNVLNDPGLSENWKSGFRKQRDNLNKYLDSYPSIRVTNDKYPSPMTNREVQDLFFYGNLIHATYNVEKRNKFKLWMSHSASKGLLTSQFIDILYITYDMIIKVSNLCKFELEKKSR